MVAVLAFRVMASGAVAEVFSQGTGPDRAFMASVAPVAAGASVLRVLVRVQTPAFRASGGTLRMALA
jgi:hypothetical protein